jgi:hypothetical protein
VNSNIKFGTREFTMTKYIVRFLVAIFAFSIGTAAIYIFARDKITTSNPNKATHSAEINSPYSVLEGTTIRIKPYGATFEIPNSWLTPKPAPDEHIKNLFLSWQELNEVNRIDGETNGFDEEEAQVINSVLPFENCAAHVGDRGWGNGLWNDLQGRVYITDLTPEEIATRVEKQGYDKASEIFERASVKSGRHGNWEKRTLDILDAPSWSDFILGENLDFYYRSFENKTVVLVFLHTDRFEEEINLILDSFKWSNKT